MSVQDARKAPFVWASVAALDHLLEHWGEEAGARVSVGRSVYYALCELGNEDRARMTLHTDSDRFRTSRLRICERAGASYKPVDKALRELERIGLVSIEDAAGEASRPGIPSFYKVLEPDPTYGASPQVAGIQPTELVPSTCGATPQVGSKPTELVPRSLYKSRSKERKKEKPHKLPDSILQPLTELATAKEADLNTASVSRAITAYPDRDHAGEAEAMLGWHRGKPNAKLKDVARGYRNWLKSADPSTAARPNLKAIDGGGQGGDSPYGKNVIKSG